MKRKGFTLIELLAVIVVLAIIALIATPIVMNTIKNAKKGAAERTADNYIKQVETTIAEKKLENNPLTDGLYTIDSNGNLTGNGLTEPVTIDMSGNKPTSGKITIKNNGVDQDNSNVKIGDYIVSYDKDNNKQQAQELYKGVLCKAVTTATNGNIPQGKFAYGDEYTCELGDNEEKTFFVLETNGDNVSLIMNKNIDSNGKGTTSGNTVAWVTKEDYLAAGGTSNDYGRIGNNKFGPITAEKALKKNTKTWTKLTESQISLPSYDQINKAAGNKTSGLSTWLYGNLKVNNSAPFGYWTSTPIASRSYGAWRVSYDGYLGGYNDVGYDSNNGVRPVITVSKSNLS